MRTKYFTVIASNYFAQALTMAKSLKHYTPDADIDIWLIDDVHNTPSNSYVNIMPIPKALTDSVFQKLALKYSILELSTAVKPYIFKYYLDNDSIINIVYLDPDLYFHNSIDDIIKSGLDNNDYLLTPHTMSPLPADGKHPSDLDLLKSGTFNLGFIAVRNSSSSRNFITWWLRHLSENCWSDPSTGVFTDQKWINQAISYWPSYKVLTEPGLNVAYWNLHERDLSFVTNSYTVNNKPLYFFHFSGFMPNDFKLSKHENRYDKIKRDSALFKLANEYNDSLNYFGYSTTITKKVSVIKFQNGATLDPVILFSAKTYIEKNDLIKKEFDVNEFYTWLTLKTSNLLDNEYIKSFLILRNDVKEHFVNLGKLDAEHLIKWFQEGGADESNLDKITLIEIGVYSLPSLCYLGYFSAMSGVGDATRANLTSLQLKHYPVSIEDISSQTIFDCENFNIHSNLNSKNSEITIAHVNADMLPQVYKLKKALFRRYTISYMAWETAYFPSEWADRGLFCDEIWVPSEFVKNALGKVFQVPIFVVPHSLALPKNLFFDSASIEYREPRKYFKFLVSFDACSDVERKNPYSAILAFKEAFSSDDNVRLIIKISNADRCNRYLSRLYNLIHGCENIELISNNLSKDDYYSLLNSIDVYVSLHRGEGFGLNIQQAMAMGKPVIVTNYGGNTDFCLQDNSILIDYTLVSIDKENSQYPYYTMWAEPDISQATQAMKKLYSDKSLRLKLSRNASDYILSNYSYEKIGSIMQQRLQRISLRLSDHVRRVKFEPINHNDEFNSSSPDLVIRQIYSVILDRNPVKADIDYYRDILDRYGIKRVLRDILISKEGSEKLSMPEPLRKLLSFFWSPKTS